MVLRIKTREFKIYQHCLVEDVFNFYKYHLQYTQNNLKFSIIIKLLELNVKVHHINLVPLMLSVEKKDHFHPS